MRGSIRVVVTSARGAAAVVATTSAGATTGGLIAAESRGAAAAGVGAELGAGVGAEAVVVFAVDSVSAAAGDAGAAVGTVAGVAAGVVAAGVVGVGAVEPGVEAGPLTTSRGAGAEGVTAREASVVLACCTTPGGGSVAAADSGGLARGVAIDVTGRIGSTTSGADCVGSEIVGAGIDRSVVSGRAAFDFDATRTLSAATGAEADRAEKIRASSISAVGSRGEKLYSERRPRFRAGR